MRRLRLEASGASKRPEATEGDARRVGDLTEPLPVTEDLLAVSGAAKPTEIFRIASPCMGSGCKHFDGSNCRLRRALPPCWTRSSAACRPAPINEA
jgi:hypothetical protein